MKDHTEVWLRNVLDNISPWVLLAERIEQLTTQPCSPDSFEPFRHGVAIGEAFTIDDLARRGIFTFPWVIRVMQRFGIVKMVDKKPTGKGGFGRVRRVYQRLQ